MAGSREATCSTISMRPEPDAVAASMISSHEPVDLGLVVAHGLRGEAAHDELALVLVVRGRRG